MQGLVCLHRVPIALRFMDASAFLSDPKSFYWGVALLLLLVDIVAVGRMAGTMVMVTLFGVIGACRCGLERAVCTSLTHSF